MLNFRNGPDSWNICHQRTIVPLHSWLANCRNSNHCLMTLLQAARWTFETCRPSILSQTWPLQTTLKATLIHKKYHACSEVIALSTTGDTSFVIGLQKHPVRHPRDKCCICQHLWCPFLLDWLCSFDQLISADCGMFCRCTEFEMVLTASVVISCANATHSQDLSCVAPQLNSKMMCCIAMSEWTFTGQSQEDCNAKVIAECNRPSEIFSEFCGHSQKCLVSNSIPIEDYQPTNQDLRQCTWMTIMFWNERFDPFNKFVRQSVWWQMFVSHLFQSVSAVCNKWKHWGTATHLSFTPWRDLTVWLQIILTAHSLCQKPLSSLWDITVLFCCAFLCAKVDLIL